MQNAEKGLVCRKETRIGLLGKKSHEESGKVTENLPLVKCHIKLMQAVSNVHSIQDTGVLLFTTKSLLREVCGSFLTSYFRPRSPEKVCLKKCCFYKEIFIGSLIISIQISFMQIRNIRRNSKSKEIFKGYLQC